MVDNNPKWLAPDEARDLVQKTHALLRKYGREQVLLIVLNLSAHDLAQEVLNPPPEPPEVAEGQTALPGLDVERLYGRADALRDGYPPQNLATPSAPSATERQAMAQTMGKTPRPAFKKGKHERPKKKAKGRKKAP